MFCPNCGARAEGDFCGHCGARTAAGWYTGSPVVSTDVALRAGAYLLDGIPAVIAGLVVGWIPLVGAIMLGFILFFYWLLRDVAGASLGKMLLGLKVVKKGGSRASLMDRILRNADLAAGPALLMIPIVGVAIAPTVCGMIFLTEVVLLVAKKERLGDMLAGTAVVKRSEAARAARL